MKGLFPHGLRMSPHISGGTTVEITPPDIGPNGVGVPGVELGPDVTVGDAVGVPAVACGVFDGLGVRLTVGADVLVKVGPPVVLVGPGVFVDAGGMPPTKQISFNVIEAGMT